MKIGLFAPGRSRQASRIEAAFNRLEPGCCTRFDLNFFEDDRTSLEATRVVWNGHDLHALDAVVLQGFDYCDPVIPAAPVAPDWSVWRQDYLAEQQTYSYLHSLFLDLRRRGVRVYNDPDALQNCYAKPGLFERLRAAGLAVPRTLASNHMETVKAFAASAGTAIWRPVTGRAHWQLFLDAQREALVSQHKPPVWVAETKPGPLLRAYVCDGEVLLITSYGPPLSGPPEELELFQEVLRQECHTELKQAAALAGGRFQEVLFVPAEGRTWIYELQTDMNIEGLPQATQESLCERLAACIMQRPIPQPPAEAPALHRRAMFLRRMLRILFEFEESKYA